MKKRGYLKSSFSARSGSFAGMLIFKCSNEFLIFFLFGPVARILVLKGTREEFDSSHGLVNLIRDNVQFM